jgi:thiol-disulfide isomerase/thioredoxin
MNELLLVIRLVLFCVFALAAVGKFLDLKGSEKAVKDFGTPEEFAKTFAIALPFAEIVFAFCFLFVWTSWLGAIGALLLLLSFTGGMIWQMAKGNAPDCHCFGQLHSEPVGKKSLIRNIVFSLLALFLVSQGRDGQGLSLTDGNSNLMQIILIFTLIILVAVALFYIRKLTEKQNEILRRLELIEQFSTDGQLQERNDAGSPHDGLPIGAPFPDFDLTDMSDRHVSRNDLMKKERPSISFFMSPTCNPCQALLPEIEKWEAELGNRVNFVIFSSGTRDENLGKFKVYSGDVILDEKREVAEMVYARWTPTAIFIRSDGTIGSHPAAGDGAIRELIDQVRSEKVDANDVYFAGESKITGKAPKIGTPVPEFRLDDIKGNAIGPDSFLGKRTLAVFWSPSCPHCTAMMDDLRAWDKTRTDSDPNLIVFSDGDKDAHANLELNAPIVIDAGYKTAEKIGMFGTPSAVMLDESGKVISETALGASTIWALVGKRK